jgi:hypothetical protein
MRQGARTGKLTGRHPFVNPIEKVASST